MQKSQDYKIPDTTGPLLTYHELQMEPGSDQYKVACQDFENHLEVVSRITASGDINRICMSFDDGHRSNIDLALPRLNCKQLKAIFFVTCGWTGVKDFAMGWGDLAELISSGHSIQSHGLSHTLLTNCSDNELTQELRGSREMLEDRLGISVTAISMPGGRWNDRVIRACAQAGYRRVYTSDPLWTPIFRHGLRVYGRIMVRKNTSANEVESFLTGKTGFWLSLHMSHALKRGMRSVVGDAAYQALWRKLSRREQPNHQQFSAVD